MNVSSTNKDPEFIHAAIHRKIQCDYEICFFAWNRKNFWIHSNTTSFGFFGDDVVMVSKYGGFSGGYCLGQSHRIEYNESHLDDRSNNVLEVSELREFKSSSFTAVQKNYLSMCAICKTYTVKQHEGDFDPLPFYSEEGVAFRIELLRLAAQRPKVETSAKIGLCHYHSGCVTEQSWRIAPDAKGNHAEFFKKMRRRMELAEAARPKFRETETSVFALLNATKALRLK